jgi:hypothetical protein
MPRVGLSLRAWLRMRALLRFWTISTPVILIVRGNPQRCLHTLAAAARPSTERLHLRNLFASGRRYEIMQRENGFMMRTTSKVSWHYRRRTTAAAIMRGAFTPLDEDITRVQLNARISLNCLANTLIYPTGLALIIAWVPWPPLLISIIIGIAYGLSWVGNRANAALEAGEMVFFVQKALEDLGLTDLPTLGAASPDLVYSRDEFSDAWEKFMREHTPDVPADADTSV